MVEQHPWLGWLADARCERTRVGTWNLGPRHSHDACGAPACRAAATSWLQGWTRVMARSLQENETGGPRIAKGRFIDGRSTSAAGGRTGKVGGAHRVVQRRTGRGSREVLPWWVRAA
jgi:hypothetical protein